MPYSILRRRLSSPLEGEVVANGVRIPPHPSAGMKNARSHLLPQGEKDQRSPRRSRQPPTQQTIHDALPHSIPSPLVGEGGSTRQRQDGQGGEPPPPIERV